MLVLIKKSRMPGLATHLLDHAGNQLCRTTIKRAGWEILDVSPEGWHICCTCRRIQAQMRYREPSVGGNC
jgi:hypothetical protein